MLQRAASAGSLGRSSPPASSPGSGGQRSPSSPTSSGRRRRDRGDGDKTPTSPAGFSKKLAVFPFDLGVFHVVAEQFADPTYAKLAASLMERAPPGSPLRNTQVKLATHAKAKAPTAHLGHKKGHQPGLKKDPEKSVVFHLPRIDEFGGMAWDLSSYFLPTGRDKASREARMQLFKYLDSSGDGSIDVPELKAAFASLVSVPGRADGKTVVHSGLDRSFLAVQELMLDGNNASKEDAESISHKEFRVFLIFLQRYLELYEIFMAIDESEDGEISVEEFAVAVPRLAAWGLNDPQIAKNPEFAFRKMDKDGGGTVTFQEFAEFCVRQGLIEEVEKEIRRAPGET